jgi:hypothetical protein
MTDPTAEPNRRQLRRQRPPRGPLLALLLVLVVAAVLGGAYLISRPTLTFANRLAGPVRLTVDSGQAALIAPGESRKADIPRGKTLIAMWELVRPLSADDQPMGEEVRGSIVIRRPTGTIHAAAAHRGVQGDYFAPLITNASDDQLRLKVNAGLEGAVDCGCAVRPGARRVFIGYYRLYRNSTVRARTGDGREAVFRDLGPSVVARDGAVGLRFESKDLRAR